MSKRRNIVFVFLATTFFIFLPHFVFSQIGNGLNEEENYVYDIVEPKTLEIDADFNFEHYSANASVNAKKIKLNIQADITYFNAPSITFRYGIIKNLEFQLITGYTGVLTKGTATIKTQKNRLISANKDVTGLSALSMGLKAGLLSNKKARPSLSFTGIVTLPNIGNPLFAPDNIGTELDLNFYNSLSNHIDITYSFGTIWSGYKDDTYNSYNYSITPGYSFSDYVGLYLDFNGVIEKNNSSENRFDVDLSFTFNDYITLDVYGGTSFNTKKFYFLGSTLTTTIPF